MASLVKPENADQLQLEIWREIMRARGETAYGNGMMVTSSAAGSYRPPPDPVASATKAVETFNALYPDPPKAQRRNASAAKRVAKARR